MKRILGIFCLILLVGALAVSAQDDEADQPTMDDLGPEWTAISTGGESICSRGTPYQFFARNGASDNLMIYFQGGGACWNGLTCREGGTFDDRVEDDEFGQYDGVFNFENDANPIADYDMVFIPYCTADIHRGDAVTEYREDLTINHAGYINTTAVLDWVYANIESPESLFITGSSAGAYGAIYYAPFIVDAYPDTDTVVLGDAGVGVTPAGWPVVDETWNTYENIAEFVEFDPATFVEPLLYEAVANQYPDVRITQFTHAEDSIQASFYGFAAPGLDPADWPDGMIANLDYLEPLENFTSYVAPGTDHTILALPEYYTLEVEDVVFNEWLTALLAGEQPETVRCVDCLPDDAAEAEDDEE
jgi:hypothetical protein